MIDYEFYTGQFCGSSIAEDSWSYYSRRAQEKLNRYKRIYTVTAPEETSEAMAVCAMADVLAYIDAAQNGKATVSAASIGSVSVSYGSAAAVDLSPRGQERQLYRAACEHLDIYRG